MVRAAETTLARPTIVDWVRDRYVHLRGWEYRGKEWNRRLEVIHSLREKAMDMEREGIKPETIFDFLQQGLLDEGIASTITENLSHPLANLEEYKLPKAVLAAQPGRDNDKPLNGGWIAYTVGDAKVADDPSIWANHQKLFNTNEGSV